MAHARRSSAEEKLRRWKARNVSIYSAELSVKEQQLRESYQKQKRRAEFEEILQEALRRANEEVGM